MIMLLYQEGHNYFKWNRYITFDLHLMSIYKSGDRMSLSLHKKWIFPLRISLINVTKSAGIFAQCFSQVNLGLFRSTYRNCDGALVSLAFAKKSKTVPKFFCLVAKLKFVCLLYVLNWFQEMIYHLKV